MKNLIFATSILFILICSIVNMTAQSTQAINVRTTVSEDKKLFINYGLKAEEGIESYTVKLKFSYEGREFEPDLNNLYGDYGEKVLAGNNIVYWNYANEFLQDINKVKVEVLIHETRAPQAIATIISTSNNKYAPCEVKFENKSTDANIYDWDFGDPSSGASNTSTESSPTHIYNKGGIYTVILTATNTLSQLESKFYQSIEILEHEKTNADFEIVGANTFPPAKVEFKNLSSNANKFTWDFGDRDSKTNNKSSELNPVHRYSQPGSYRVLLTAFNTFSGIPDTISKVVVIHPRELPPVKFSYVTSGETAPATVNFNNLTKNAPLLKWDFGDPSSGKSNSSREKKPTHIYKNPGEYIVTLETFNLLLKKLGSTRDTLTFKAKVKSPKALFTIDNNNAYAPATILFTNKSTDATSYLWTFGDSNPEYSNTSTKENPMHTYFKAGTYKVVLEATNDELDEKSVYSADVIIRKVPNE
ncbi:MULTISPECIES: PKD domain-containing protein [unclassified Saccharicrinis]|uniref:PKD domain-containing protein n=1 Tax=unclassified Saccharicrinis TaxID=2646859 RepID=UPI003D356D39